ncbi:sister chromatid separation protein [Ophiostoma piceae UAMH 11346]|uniref:Sister chromatid separation protein n=1 Tax=Ophiostoma piceae (strain UAMH 11346) TaxID=1262450 RepID=S3D3F6_OPHP1|nr:sister chromatid separation protein [Ophiostoma piceae UAMH 11346]
MSDSEVDYLQPGFDPASLTNPRLRSILVTYNVHYASNAKKPELVELFAANVAPQAKKILARRARAKRSSMGIVDAAAGQSATFDDDEEEEDLSRTKRRSSPRKRASRSVSHQPADQYLGVRNSDSEHELPAAPSSARPPSRRARTKTPQVKLEPTDEERFQMTPAPSTAATVRQKSYQTTHSHQQQQSVFSSDNPFQSGSSPMSGSSPTNRQESRRRTTGYTDEQPTLAVAPSARKRLDGSRVVSSPALQPTSYESPAVRAAAQRRVSPFASARMPSLTPEPEQEEEEDEVSEEEEEEDDDEEADGYDPLAPGEEFTPEEQLELTQEEEVVRQQLGRTNKSQKKVAPKRKTGGRSVASALATPLLVLTLTLLSAYGVWYRQEKLAVGFCGLGRPAVPLFAEQLDKLSAIELPALPEWLEWVERVPDYVPDPVYDLFSEYIGHAELPSFVQTLIEPQCEQCPQHAFCYSDFTVRCENGYIEKAHPLALGGLVPLPPTCEPDGERARRVKAVADKAIEELRDRRAKWECGDLIEDDGQAADSPAMDVPLLKEAISEKRSKKMSKEEFDDLWTAAIGDIESRDEVESESDANYAATDPGTVPNTRLSSTSLARLPLRCAVRRSIRLGLARFRLPLSVLVLSVLSLLYMRARYRSHRATLARVPALVDLVLERLAAQKELWLYDEGDNDDDDEASPDQFLFLPQLRDDVLRSTHSLKARERVWKHVQAVVEQNSNVRTGQREGRNGEVGRAWEWIGPVGTAGAIISGANTSADLSVVRRRRSGRPSMAPGSRAGSVARESLPRESLPRDNNVRETVEDGDENKSALHRRWQESRPIY